VLALADAAGARGQSITPSDTFQPWHSVMYRSVLSPKISPDGRQIAFLRAEPRRPLQDENGPSRVALYLFTEDGREIPFVAGDVTVSNVLWMDNEHLAFSAKRHDDKQRAVYRISTRGGEATKVFEFDRDVSAFDISRDGRWLALLAVDEKTQARKDLEKKGFNHEIYEEDRPFTRLRIADLHSGDRPDRRETTLVSIDGSVQSVEFARDGRHLLVALTPTPLVDATYVSQRLRVITRDGSIVGRIENPGKIGAAEWSPDGQRVAFIAAADRHDPAPGRLMVADAVGAEMRDLMPALEGHVAAFGWADASTIAYIVDLGTGTEVGTIQSDGSGRRVLLPAGRLVGTSLAAHGNGLVALVAQSPQHPDELYTLRAGSAERRTVSNEWLADLRFARQEVVRYAARDGLDLEGVLIYPLDVEQGRRYPLILVVHGGPEAHYRNGWLTGYATPGQVAAARGFAVFYPNYRGSTGRGVEFSKISQATAAGPEFDDLVDGVDHLIAAGLVDRDRVGITGGSYGGYASAWGATYYSERFAAAVPFVGISNAVSKMGTTDIPQEMYDVHHRKWLWEDWQYFVEASPVYYVTRNRTATLILHGKDDPRVHPSQSLELYRHLRLLNQAPVRLVLYPGEGHGNRLAAARLDYALRTLQWMEHYLKGPGGEPPARELEYARHLPWPADKEAVTEEQYGEGVKVADPLDPGKPKPEPTGPIPHRAVVQVHTNATASPSGMCAGAIGRASDRTSHGLTCSADQAPR
jgi:dipeptidyl aminopeptidase/acylaminoacyl peptidase